jgi:RNA polymerase sigma factor (sigma-70 family)
MSMDPRHIEFEELYNKYNQDLYIWTLYRVKDKHLAEEIQQKTWLKIWQYWDKWEDRGIDRKAFMYRVAGNHIVDYYRDQHNKDYYISPDFDEDMEAGIRTEQNLIISEDKKEETMEELFIRLAKKGYFKGMRSPEYLMLVYYRAIGYKNPDLEKLYDMNTTDLKKALFRTRNSLRSNQPLLDELAQ